MVNMRNKVSSSWQAVHSKGRWLALLLAGLLSLSIGCTSTGTSGAEGTDQQGQQSQQGDDQQNGLDEEPEFLDDDKEDATYDHPRVATSRETRHFVRSFLAETDRAALERCQQQAQYVSQEPSSRPIFLKNLRQVKDKIENEPLLYHRCFYYGLMRLDSQLASRRYGDDLEKVNLEFFTRIRASALLATALGQHLDTPQYVDFLRSRYIELSYSYFGRSVVPEDEKLPRQFPSYGKGRKKAPRGKPAGHWQP